MDTLKTDTVVINSLPYDAISPAASISGVKPPFERHDTLVVPLSSTSPMELSDPDQQNAWMRFRQRFRKPLAEFVGTAILLIIGCAADCQTVLAMDPSVAGGEKGGYMGVCLGWGAGAAFGIWSCIGISGGHINPAVSLVNVLFRGMSWTDFAQYVIAQVSGAFFGSLAVYGVYSQAIGLADATAGGRKVPGTAGLFTTFPKDYMSLPTGFFSEVLATAILLIIIFSVTDKRNGAPPLYLVPLAAFVGVTALTVALSVQTGAAMNPARDLGPRLMTAMFYGREVFSYRSFYGLWSAIFADFLGAVVGALAYDGFIYTGEDSWVNRSCGMPTLNLRSKRSMMSTATTVDAHDQV